MLFWDSSASLTIQMNLYQIALWCWQPHILGIDGVVPTSLHILATVSNRVVVVNILSDLLEGWCQSLDLRHCLNYVFSLLLKAHCEAPEIL